MKNSLETLFDDLVILIANNNLILVYVLLTTLLLISFGIYLLLVAQPRKSNRQGVAGSGQLRHQDQARVFP